MQEMTARQLYTHLKSTGQSTLILDVREAWEFAIARLPGALHIPTGDIHSRIQELDRNAEIVVVCHHGIRSRRVAHLLEQNKFTRVINLSDGIAGWARDIDPEMPAY